MSHISGWTDELPFLLFRANQLVQHDVFTAMEKLGTTIAQLGIGLHLERFGPLSASDIARQLKISPQSASTTLGVLERHQWVLRRPHPVHRRVIWFELTELGAERVNEGYELLAEYHRSLEAHLGADFYAASLAQLTELVHRLDTAASASGTLWPVATDTSP